MRTFLALEVPSSVRSGIASLLMTLQAQSAPGSVRWARPENIHLTLAFLGETPTERTPAIAELVGRLAGETPRFELTVGGVGAFPRIDSPRVIWLGLRPEDGPLSSFQARIAEGLRDLGWEVDGGPFRGHLTVGRVRKDASRPQREALVHSLRRAPLESWTFLAETVSLIESQLTRDGPRYESLASANLRRAA